MGFTGCPDAYPLSTILLVRSVDISPNDIFFLSGAGRKSEQAPDTMAHPPLLLLPILVAMAAAAPLAENVNKEQAVRVSGDVAVVDRGEIKKKLIDGFLLQ